MTTTDLEHFCPHCGRRQDAVTGRPGTTPTEGAVGLCWKCGGAAIWTNYGGWRLRMPTEAEAAEIDADSEVARLRAAIKASETPLQAADVAWGSS